MRPPKQCALPTACRARAVAWHRQAWFAVENLSRPANLSAAVSDAAQTDSGGFLLGLDALGNMVSLCFSHR